MWLPFMEMGQRPGQMVYASNSFKLKNKVADLPKAVREYTEKHHPKYLEPPSEWQGLSVNENTWSYSKKFIDARRAEGKVKPDGSGLELIELAEGVTLEEVAGKTEATYTIAPGLA